MSDQHYNSTPSEKNNTALSKHLLIHRRRILIAVSVIGLCLSFLLGMVFSNRERQLREMQFRTHAGDRVAALKSSLASRMATLKSVSSFYAGSEEVERHEFRAFTHPILSDNNDIEFLAWLPIVSENLRTDFEQQMQKDGFADCRIRDFDGDGKLRNAEKRSEYYPVMFVESQEEHRYLIGYDLNADHSARAAIERVMSTKGATIAQCYLPNSMGVSTPMLCLFEYAQANPTHTEEMGISRRLDTGIVISTFQLRMLLEKAIEPMPTIGVNMYFFEETAPGKTALLLARPSRAEKNPLPAAEHPPENQSGMDYLVRLIIADRSWIVYCLPVQLFLQGDRSLTPLIAVLAGLIFTAIMSGFSYLLIGRSEQVEILVEHRTMALQASEERFRRLVDGAADAFFLFDNQGRLFDVNRCACESLGYTREELLNMGVLDIQIKPLTGSEGEPYWKNPEFSQPTTYEGIHRRKNGETFPVEIRVTFLKNAGQHWCLALVRDITARKQTEADLQAEQRMLRQLLDLLETDRKLVAYEIHDGLAQQLTGLLMHLQAMQFSQENHNPEAALEMLPKAVELLGGSIAEVRRLIGGLRPPILDEAGVVAAIDYLVGEKRQTESVAIEFNHDVRFGHLASPLESAIFRIVQECLTNACRYSQSKKIEIDLKQSNGTLQLRIQDWGVGFNPQQINGQHLGLRGIRERARLLGGNAEIVSALDAGTTVTVQLPLVVRPEEE
jgi:PAS domain S-box-containing protein